MGAQRSGTNLISWHWTLIILSSMGGPALGISQEELAERLHDAQSIGPSGESDVSLLSSSRRPTVAPSPGVTPSPAPTEGSQAQTPPNRDLSVPPNETVTPPGTTIPPSAILPPQTTPNGGVNPDGSTYTWDTVPVVPEIQPTEPPVELTHGAPVASIETTEGQIPPLGKGMEPIKTITPPAITSGLALPRNEAAAPETATTQDSPRAIAWGPDLKKIEEVPTAPESAGGQGLAGMLVKKVVQKFKDVGWATMDPKERPAEVSIGEKTSAPAATLPLKAPEVVITKTAPSQAKAPETLLGFFDVPITPPAPAVELMGGINNRIRDLVRETAAFVSRDRADEKVVRAGLLSETAKLFKLPGPIKTYLKHLAGSSYDSRAEVERVSRIVANLMLAWIPASLLILLIVARRRKKGRALAVMAACALMTAPEIARAGEAKERLDLTVGEALMGSSDFYSGGELLEGVLAKARARIREGAALLSSDSQKDQLCSFRECARTNEASFCAPLEGISAAQQKSCSAFLRGYAGELARLALPEATPFRVSAVPLIVRSRPGKSRGVAAVTRSGAEGIIVFHLGTLQHLDEKRLMALLAHELGHKLKPSSGLISDEGAAYGFTDGKLFLDAVGTALAVYSINHALPSQEPASLASNVTFDNWCAFARSAGPLSAAVVADAENHVPDREEMIAIGKRLATLQAADPQTGRLLFAQGIFSSDRARMARVEEYFQRYLLRPPTSIEKELFRIRLREGVAQPAILSSIIGHPQYLESRGISVDRFPEAAFTDLFGRIPTPEETRATVKLAAGLDRPSLVAHWLAFSSHPMRRWVSEWYRRLLNRAPGEQELVADLAVISEGNEWETLAPRIAASSEYAALQTKRMKACSRTLSLRALGAPK